VLKVVQPNGGKVNEPYFDLLNLAAFLPVPFTFLRIGCVVALWTLLACCQSQEGPVDQSTLRGTDYRLFQGTPLWGMAQAAQADDASRLTALGKTSGLDVDTPEPRFGKTVLLLAVANEDYAACQALLGMGASPNAHDRYNGTSPLLQAAAGRNPAFVELLLAHGGNPNDVETGARPSGNTRRNTPLINAARHSLATARALVAAGANVNYENEFGTTALSVALIQDQFAVALFLLQHGADPRKPVLQRPTPAGRRPVYLPEYLAEVRKPGQNDAEIAQILAFLRTRKGVIVH